MGGGGRVEGNQMIPMLRLGASNYPKQHSQLGLNSSTFHEVLYAKIRGEEGSR